MFGKGRKGREGRGNLEVAVEDLYPVPPAVEDQTVDLGVGGLLVRAAVSEGVGWDAVTEAFSRHRVGKWW